MKFKTDCIGVDVLIIPRQLQIDRFAKWKGQIARKLTKQRRLLCLLVRVTSSSYVNGIPLEVVYSCVKPLLKDTLNTKISINLKLLIRMWQKDQ